MNTYYAFRATSPIELSFIASFLCEPSCSERLQCLLLLPIIAHVALLQRPSYTSIRITRANAYIQRSIISSRENPSHWNVVVHDQLPLYQSGSTSSGHCQMKS